MKDERDRLHVVALFEANGSDGSLELYQPWLGNLVDEAPVANSTDVPNLSEKELAQFYHLLETCHETSAPYTAVFERSIVAMDGWLRRTLAALDSLEGMTTAGGKTPKDFLYLSLFYSEKSLDWKREDFPSCVTGAVALFAAVAIGIFSTRRYCPATRPHLTGNVIMAILLIYTPLVVALYFAAGKVTMLPPAPGLGKESHVGQYTQALVLLPREKVEEILQWPGTATVATVADLSERFASKHGGTVWTLRPAAIQHIGSKGEEWRGGKPGEYSA